MLWTLLWCFSALDRLRPRVIAGGVAGLPVKSTAWQARTGIYMFFATTLSITAWHLRAGQHVTMEISSHLSSHTDIDHLPVLWTLPIFNAQTLFSLLACVLLHLHSQQYSIWATEPVNAGAGRQSSTSTVTLQESLMAWCNVAFDLWCRNQTDLYRHWHLKGIIVVNNLLTSSSYSRKTGVRWYILNLSLFAGKLLCMCGVIAPWLFSVELKRAYTVRLGVLHTCTLVRLD